MLFERNKENPLLQPDRTNNWEAVAAFNPSVVKSNEKYIMLYRALSEKGDHYGETMEVSSIGYCESNDGIHFGERKHIILPEKEWEKFGCEDPRISRCGEKYYIFYTALSSFPFSAQNIRIGLAITRDFKSFEKHEVTPFNSKAMALFPEKINGKYAAILTVHTDLPPAKIALALFDKEEDIWSEVYWSEWYAQLDAHVIPLLRDANDHVEVGAVPVKTEKGWLLIYSYIQNYFTGKRIFGVEAVLLDPSDPSKILGKTTAPLLQPERGYELFGDVPDIIFPTGAIVENEHLHIYYGASDTSSCMATGKLQELLNEFKRDEPAVFLPSKWIKQSFQRYQHNPIIAPRSEFYWEAKATFNPAVIYENNAFHILYRAMSYDNTSVLGYARSMDGIHIDERLHYPVYVPRAGFEKKLRPGNSGCEDPRITKMGNELFMFYTAFDGYTPRVAFTSISIADFLNKNWNWKPAKVITPPNIPDKDACLLDKKINGKYVVFHRAYDCICINMENNLDFGSHNWLVHHTSLIEPRKTYWDNSKFGLAAPPIETLYGWLMFYHRASMPNSVYKVEAALLDLNDPSTILAQTDATLLEPEMKYEEEGIVNNVVFPCGAVLKDNLIYLYYGGGDRVTCVARMDFLMLMKRFGICV